MQQFYYQHQNQTLGPVPLEFILDLYRDGLLQTQTRIRSENDETWYPLAAFLPPKNEASPSSPDPTSRASQANVGKSPAPSPEQKYSPSLPFRAFLVLSLFVLGICILFLRTILYEENINQDNHSTAAEIKQKGPSRLPHVNLEEQQKANHLAQTERILISLRDLRNLRGDVRDERLRQLEANVVRSNEIFATQEILEFYGSLKGTLRDGKEWLAAWQTLEAEIRETKDRDELFSKRMQRAQIMDKLENLENSFASYETYLQDRN